MIGLLACLGMMVMMVMMVMMAGMASGQPGVTNRELVTVMIDPGHGGSDPGAVSAGVREKDIVLDISLRLGEKIREAYPGVRVLYTRSKDVFIPLHARASAAIKNKADLFISVHANWVTQTSVRGTETFTLGLHRSQDNLEVAKKENSVILLEEDYSANYEGFNPNETESYIMFENMQSEYQSQSISLAARIQEEFTRNLRLSDRGVKQAGFLVLRQITMPGVLVEVGFISHPAERKFLVSAEGKEKVAESLFKAFTTYKREIDSRSRFAPLAGNDTTGEPVVAVQESPSPAPGAAAEPRAMSDSTSGKTAPSGNATSRGEQSTSPEKEGVPPGNVPAKEAHPPMTTGRDSGGTKNPPASSTGNSAGKSQPAATSWYAVQIGAVNKELAPTPENFRGEKSVYRIRVAPYYKFYSGKFGTAGEAAAEKKRLSAKFPQAFVVLIENGVPRPLQKSELP